MKSLRAAIIAALFLLLPLSAIADDVTLISRDGAIELSGTLMGFDGEFYRIDTEYGVLTVDGSGVICDGPGCPGLGPYVAHITLSGAREMGQVLLPSLIEGFALRNGFALSREEEEGRKIVYTLYDGAESNRKAAVITLLLTNSSEGFADLIGNAADIVMSLREASAQERAMAREIGLGDIADHRLVRVLAHDALVPVISPGNPVRRLSLRQLAEVFSGRITNWAELGGEDAPITSYLLDEGAGFSELFTSSVVDGQGVRLSRDVERRRTNEALVEAVVADPFGLGVSLYSQTGNAGIVTLSGDCGFEVRAAPESVKAEDYPLSAPMYLYLPALRLPKIGRDFLDYLRSDAAQIVIRRVGLVDQMPGLIGLQSQGVRLVNAIRAAGDEIGLGELKRLADLMDRQTRLTVTFRFRGGSTALDAPSQSNVALLAHALQAGRFDGHMLTFVGFSDGQGAAEQNRRLSLKRAQVVLEAVRAAAELPMNAGQVTLRKEAFGEALPMACDDSEWGRRVNRRVEVWLD
ncbi:MAG TPA: cell envelope biogenesis protein OmpA [Aliiroseovarius sp.]|nr:cell envelope biogenesis protein OmpA [Aliiroseovarius sp.]